MAVFVLYDMEISTRRAVHGLRRCIHGHQAPGNGQEGLPYDINEGTAPSTAQDRREDQGRSAGPGNCTISDFNLPERFDILHRLRRRRHGQSCCTGHPAPSRFIGVLIEHFTSAFPVWISPVQAVVISRTPRPTMPPTWRPGSGERVG